MRVSFCPPTASFTCLLMLGCDSGQTSAPPAMDTNNAGSGSPTMAAVSTQAVTAAVTNTMTVTSTTGNPAQGGGLVHQTGRGCTPGIMGNSGQLMGQWGKIKFTVDGLEYWIQVNEWNSMATQVMTYGGGSFFKLTTQNASAPTTGAPTGYPSIFIGGNSGNVTNNSNLPKQVSTLAAIPTTWDWNDAGTLGNIQTHSYNAAYDVWFSVGADGEPNSSHPSGAFLMVWYHQPFDAQPIGSPIAQNATVANVPGQWTVWLGDNAGTPVISYVTPTTISYMDFDLNDFIKDAIARGGSVQASHYLTNIFAGFEIWRGGVGLETTAFCAQVF